MSRLFFFLLISTLISGCVMHFPWQATPRPLICTDPDCIQKHKIARKNKKRQSASKRNRDTTAKIRLKRKSDEKKSGEERSRF